MSVNIKAELQIAGSCRAAFVLCMGAGYLQNRASGEGDMELAMLPIMDLLNHNSSTGTTVSHLASTQLEAPMHSDHLMTCGSHAQVPLRQHASRTTRKSSCSCAVHPPCVELTRWPTA